MVTDLPFYCYYLTRSSFRPQGVVRADGFKLVLGAMPNE